MARHRIHDPSCPRDDPMIGFIDDCTCGEAARTKQKGQHARITFRRKKRERFCTYDSFEIHVDKAVIGGVQDQPGKIGYAIAAGSCGDRLAWKNTWADGEVFATVEDAKRACVEHIRKALTAASTPA